MVQESGLAQECWIYWGKFKVELWEVLDLAGWFAYSVHAPLSPDGSRIGHTFVDVFIDIMSTFRNKATWRDKSAIGRLIAAFYPLAMQRYVDLLLCARSLKCTDQRDIIYASLGSPLAYHDDGEIIIAPDYEEPLSALQTRAAKALLRNPREAAHVLLRVSHETEDELEDADVPSWAPRWTSVIDAEVRPIMLSWTFEYRLEAYCASRGSPPFEPLVSQSNVLTVTGFVFNTITWELSAVERRRPSKRTQQVEFAFPRQQNFSG